MLGLIPLSPTILTEAIDLEPNARGISRIYAPPIRDVLDQEEPAPGRLIGPWFLDRGLEAGATVGHLYPHDALRDDRAELYPVLSILDTVRHEFVHQEAHVIEDIRLEMLCEASHRTSSFGSRLWLIG